MSKMIHCAKLNKDAEALEHAPYPGDLGQKIHETVSAEAWQMWLAHQTILINEYRLSMLDPAARKMLEEEMVKFLFEGTAEVPDAFKPIESKE